MILKGVYRLVEALTDYALDELYDVEGLKKKLRELALSYEMGEINDKEYETMEKKLLFQLTEARKYHSGENGEEEDDTSEKEV